MQYASHATRHTQHVTNLNADLRRRIESCCLARCSSSRGGNHRLVYRYVGSQRVLYVPSNKRARKCTSGSTLVATAVEFGRMEISNLRGGEGGVGRCACD